MEKIFQRALPLNGSEFRTKKGTSNMKNTGFPEDNRKIDTSRHDIILCLKNIVEAGVFTII
jgi:hypothetical protein